MIFLLKITRNLLPIPELHPCSWSVKEATLRNSNIWVFRLLQGPQKPTPWGHFEGTFGGPQKLHKSFDWHTQTAINYHPFLGSSALIYMNKKCPPIDNVTFSCQQLPIEGFFPVHIEQFDRIFIVNHWR